MICAIRLHNRIHNRVIMSKFMDGGRLDDESLAWLVNQSKWLAIFIDQEA